MLKRGLNSKLLASLFVVLMTVCVSAFAGLRDESWAVSPSDFRYDMSLYFRMENKDFEDLSSFEIGAFVDDECRGLAEKLEFGEGESCLYMRIRSNKADGEDLSFYMKDKKTGQIVLVKGEDGSTIAFKADTRIGMPSDPFAMSTFYTAVFKIDGEIVETLEVGYGDPIKTPEVPAKEGYTFNGWGDVPASMPAYDIEVQSSYTVNTYSLTFKVGDEDIYSGEIAYGSSIIVPEAPAKDGYSFTGWGDVPSTMPAKDLVFQGEYTINTYKVVFRIDQEVFQTLELEYGAPIEQPVAPELEGRSFSGWGDVPAEMPAFDLVFVGTYADNYYTITFKVDEEIIKIADLAYGAEILLPEVPEREGYSFSGWGDVPSAMPASNIEIVGSYSINNYMMTFRIGDDIVFSGEIPYGSEIIAPEAPIKEGYSFAGWGMVPSVMPAYDLEITGSYDVNIYNISFVVDGETVYSTTLAYGSEILPPFLSEKEGATFSGWGEIPSGMPANDLTIYGTYSVNYYLLVFKIGEEVLFTGEVPYGAEVIVPEVAEKEGHSFSGWGEVPATMPARTLEFVGSYDPLSYQITFKIADETVLEAKLPYGAEIILPEVEEKEGYSFSGWGVVPATMPASDLEFSGAYEVNYYNVTFMLNEDVVYSAQLPYGAEIIAPDMSSYEDNAFSGWSEYPSTVPAHDVVVYGTLSDISAVGSMVNDSDRYPVVNLEGVVIKKNASDSEIKNSLEPGLYIINGKKVMIKTTR